MKIGIYKPFKEVYFFDDSKDYAGWSYEVASVSKIFADRGHDVYMLSASDLDYSPEYDSCDNKIYNKSFANDIKFFDRIFYFCGTTETDKPTILEELRAKTDRLDLILTDLKLKPERFDLFDNVYTQSEIYGKYNGLPEIVFYNDAHRDVDESIKNKTMKCYFGGTERNRVDDFFEYVWRPEFMVKGKSELLRFNNRIGRTDNFKLWTEAKYTITIADIDYNDIGFITPRYYDNIRFNVVGFVDYKYDKHGHCLKLNDWRRVHNYKEMIDKMNYLDDNPEEYRRILLEQRNEIKKEYITGEFTYHCLMK
jgi:hypothetical protein